MFAVAFLWVRTRVTGEIGGDTEHPALRNLSMGQRSLLMLGLVPELRAAVHLAGPPLG